MKRQVVGDEPEVIGDLPALEQMSPLHPVRTGRVLQEQRDPLPGLLEVHPVIVTVEIEMEVAAHRCIEPRCRSRLVDSS